MAQKRVCSALWLALPIYLSSRLVYSLRPYPQLLPACLCCSSSSLPAAAAAAPSANCVCALSMLTQFGQLPIKRQVMKLMPLSLACYALLLLQPCPCFCSCPYCSLLPSSALLHACRLQTEEQAKHSEFNWQLMLLWSSGHLPCSLSPSLSCSSILAAGSTKRKPPASCLPVFSFFFAIHILPEAKSAILPALHTVCYSSKGYISGVLVLDINVNSFCLKLS